MAVLTALPDELLVRVALLIDETTLMQLRLTSQRLFAVTNVRAVLHAGRKARRASTTVQTLPLDIPKWCVVEAVDDSVCVLSDAIGGLGWMMLDLRTGDVNVRPLRSQDVHWEDPGDLREQPRMLSASTHAGCAVVRDYRQGRHTLSSRCVHTGQELHSMCTKPAVMHIQIVSASICLSFDGCELTQYDLAQRTSRVLRSWT